MKVSKVEEYCIYPQGVCRIRKPAYAGNGCAIFPTFDTAQLEENIHCSAADDLFRGSPVKMVVVNYRPRALRQVWM